MDAGWDVERERVAGSFDTVADLYRIKYATELDAKPFDRALLGELATAIGRDTPGSLAFEVGAGPGQVSAFLRERGVPVVASDASRRQTRQARRTVPERPAVVTDLARLPVRSGALGALVAFYCLIYGPPQPLDAVFAEWRRALVRGGRVVLAVHAGEGTIHVDEWQGRPVDITVVLRDPDDLVARLTRQGFSLERAVTRPPEAQEHPTDRFYAIAVAA